MSEEPRPETNGSRSPTLGFAIHGVVAVLALAVLNWLIATKVPMTVGSEGEGEMGPYYLIFYYHFPGAINCYVFFIAVMVFGILFLRDGNPLWDARARVAGEIGLLACTITVATGSTWAKSAWNVWWDFTDPRLMSAAVMWLTYAGYVVLQQQIEEPNKRRRYAAVFGILACLNVPFVHYSIQLIGVASHPMKITADPIVRITQWYGVVAFFFLYALIYRWKLERNLARDAVEECLVTVRKIEEGARA